MPPVQHRHRSEDMTDKIRNDTKARRPKRWIHRKFLGIPLGILVPAIAVVVAAVGVYLGPISPTVNTNLHQMNAAVVISFPTGGETTWGQAFTYSYINVTITLNSYTGAHTAYPLLAFDTSGATPCTTLSTTNFFLLGGPTYATNLSGVGQTGSGVSNGFAFYGGTTCVFWNAALGISVPAGSLTQTWAFKFKYSANVGTPISLIMTAQFTQ